MMDNRMYNAPTDVTVRNSSIIDGIVPHSSMNSLVQSSYSFDLNNQNHMMSLVPVLSNFHGETDVIDSHLEFNESNPSFGRRHNVRESSFVCSSFTDNPVFHGAPSCPAAISTLLASRGSLQEELNNLAISTISAIPSNCSETDYVPNNNPNSLFGNSVNCGYDELLHSMNSQWEVNKYSSGTSDFGEWLPSNAASELALTLATSAPMDLRNQHSSDAGCSGTAQPSSNQNSSSNSEEHSLSYASSCKRPQLSQVICGSRYLHVVQEILSDIATYSLENLDHSCFSSARHATAAMDADFEAHNDPALRKQDIKTKKEKLMSLLQMLDECYNQCVDEIHTVVSAFHAATDSDPHIHARFALQTISVLYKNLRERISTHFLAMGTNSNPASPSESERSYEIQKQLALQHLKKKDHQIWRPQRGLPERSVSVLRAWMFQNFLHPYPKDAEKHVLAVKSGLTRNQVSNWFINARVRLWKPMIEEMYAEMNRRKIRQSDNSERNLRGHHHMTINNHKFGIN